MNQNVEITALILKNAGAFVNYLLVTIAKIDTAAG
jgi:hypothetical protein